MKQITRLLIVSIATTALAPKNSVYANQNGRSKTKISTPERLQNQGYQLRLLSRNYSINSNDLDLPTFQQRTRISLLDANSRVVASTQSFYHEEMLYKLKPSRWRVGLLIGAKVPRNWDLDYYRLIPERIAIWQSEISYQPGSFGIVIGLSAASSASDYKTVTSSYDASSVYLLGQYEHVPLNRHPEVQIAYLLGPLLTTHKITFREDDFKMEGEKGSTFGYLAGVQLRVMTPIPNLWLSGRILYGVYTSGDMSKQNKGKGHLATFTTESLGVNYDF